MLLISGMSEWDKYQLEQMRKDNGDKTAEKPMSPKKSFKNMSGREYMEFMDRAGRGTF